MKLILLILSIPLCVVAQTPVQSTAPKTNEPTTGTISGKVVNETGQPMPGVSAFIRAVNSNMGRTTATDAEGNFQVNGLPAGLYIVGANAPAYTTMPSELTSPATYYRIGDSVRVDLVRGGVITGTVTNATGEPMVAVRVRATMIRDAKGQPFRSSGFGASEQPTDDRGIYRMFGLLPGTYIVSAGGLSSSQPYQFNPYDSDLPTYAPSSTRDTAAEVTVTGGEESTADIHYRGDAGYSISGTVKTAGTNGATITIAPVGPVLVGGGSTFQSANSRGFAFHGLADGEYQVLAQETAMAQGSSFPSTSLSETKRVTIKGASVTGIELTTKPMGLIRGRILLEPSKVKECEGKRAPLFSEALVQLRRPEKDPETSQPVRIFMNSASPDSKGDFTFRNIYPGKYQFDPRFYARYWYLRSITTGAAAPATPARSQAASSKTDAATNWTTVKLGEQITNLTITLAEGAASVRGKIAADTAPDMLFYLVPSEPNKADDVLRYFVTGIAADGTFTLNNLPPGRYWALAQTNSDVQTATVMRLRLPETATARTKLRKTAEAKKIELELKPCQNLTNYELKQ